MLLVLVSLLSCRSGYFTDEIKNLVVVNALLQVTVFVSAMAIDLRRVEVNFLFISPN